MSAPAYSTHGVGLFSGISGTDSLVPASIGFGLIATGFALKMVNEQGKAATGQRPDFGGVMFETVVCIALLIMHGAIAHNVWNTCQHIATTIYPDTKLSAMAELLGSVATRFKDYSFSVMDVGAALKDSAVVMVALVAWMLTLMAHWQLEVLQVCVFNIVFAFAPVLIGLSMFGFGGRRIWFAALVEVSSWSITLAIVYKTIDSALFSYLQQAKTLDFSDTKFIDVVSMLAFMASLPFVVPIVTGRLIGSSALGALANVNMGATMFDKALGSGRQAMSGIGGAVQPGASDTSSHTSATNRPGDN